MYGRIHVGNARPFVVFSLLERFGTWTAIITIVLGLTLTNEGVGHVPLISTLRGTGSTLTSYIYANSPAGEGSAPQKAYAAAFVLLMIVREGMETALMLMHKHNAIAQTMAMAGRYCGKARQALSGIPHGRQKSAMLDIVEFCAARAY